MIVCQEVSVSAAPSCIISAMYCTVKCTINEQMSRITSEKLSLRQFCKYQTQTRLNLIYSTNNLDITRPAHFLDEFPFMCVLKKIEDRPLTVRK